VSWRVAQLLSITLFAWLLIAFPAEWIWGEGMLLQSAVAMGLCLVPGVGILLVAGRAQSQSPEWRIGITLLGALVRMGFVLGVGAILYKTMPVLGENGFWIWLLVFYLFTLAVEVGLLLQTEHAAMGACGTAKDKHGA
jgi:hypothetical protein